ncbi:MAG: GyrI-like domain-containing protein [Phycisphaerales bacterium]|nr:GyrI-like domain-containing protein [Phycisphaerales bacterium]
MLESTEVRTLPDIRVAAVAHRGPYVQIGMAFSRLMSWGGPRGLIRPDARCIGIYYDNPRTTPEPQLRSHAAIEVGPDVAPDPSSGVEVLSLPGGRFCVGVLKGPYSGLTDAWRWLLDRHLPDSGLRIDDRPNFEIYLNDACNTPPEQLLTAIHVPVRD